jgi:hypothetical protein
MIDWALDAVRNELIWLLVLVAVLALVALPKLFKKIMADTKKAKVQIKRQDLTPRSRQLLRN